MRGLKVYVLGEGTPLIWRNRLVVKLMYRHPSLPPMVSPGHKKLEYSCMDLDLDLASLKLNSVHRSLELPLTTRNPIANDASIHRVGGIYAYYK